jgi:hypothetical protein
MGMNISNEFSRTEDNIQTSKKETVLIASSAYDWWQVTCSTRLPYPRPISLLPSHRSARSVHLWRARYHNRQTRPATR